MSEKVLSVIIPTYNMEKYLSKCLDSLIVPSIDKLDIIVVNDGSIDKSSDIAHSYSDKYPDSIRVIDKENGNYGSCINAALPTIKGKYVKILDADDSFDTDNLESFISLLINLNVDLVITNYETVTEKGELIKIYSTDKIQGNAALDIKEINNLSKRDLIAMHAYTYNASVFKNLEYNQTEGISYTDTEWYFLPIINCKTIAYWPYVLYRYLIGRDGQTMDPKILYKNVDNLIKVGLWMLSEYSKHQDAVSQHHKGYLTERIFEISQLIYELILIQNPKLRNNILSRDYIEFIKNNLPEINNRLLGIQRKEFYLFKVKPYKIIFSNSIIKYPYLFWINVKNYIKNF